MNIDVYIMAGGEQIRWKDDSIKQLATVDNDKWTVIKRVFALAQKFLNVEPVVVTRNIDISLATDCYSNPDVCGATLCESMLRCLEISDGEASDGVLFLLGDVYYTRPAMRAIISGSVPYFGNEVELFACKFNRQDYERAISLLQYVLDLHHDDPEGIKGKMWNMYYLWAGYRVRGHEFGRDFCLVEDDTCDFDTVEDYDAFWTKNIDDWFEL